MRMLYINFRFDAQYVSVCGQNRLYDPVKKLECLLSRPSNVILWLHNLL